MKKRALITFSILIILVLVVGGIAYGKYTNYKMGQDIENVKNLQNQKQESQVIRDYNGLLFKYKNSSEIYINLSNYYVGKHKYDNAINTLYSGIAKNNDNKILIQALSNIIKNSTLKEGYLVVNKGSKVATNSQKTPIKIKICRF